jgi:DNA recombination protein RmuC
MNAEDEQQKASALDRHLKSVRKHIDELAKKDYARKNAKSFADYVLMFMPRDMAFRVALEAYPLLWQEAYQKNVLIVTEQTIMPFLKIMQLTWNKYQHDTNTLKITQAAQNMIDRVADFYDQYIELGKKIKAVGTAYNSGVTKLQDGGRSITTSARQVISLGAKLSKGKQLNVPEDIQEIESC